MRPMLVVATTNPHKVREIQRWLRGCGIQVRSLTQFPALPPVKEDGATLQANAAKKASAACRALGLPVLADDSGLFVPALDGQPGVRSARFAGAQCDYAANNRKLLRLLQDRRGRDRRAVFATCMALAIPHRPVVSRIGKIWGTITCEPMGDHGFGYDPVFKPRGFDRTFAQMSLKLKNSMSHRALALGHILPLVRKLFQVSAGPSGR